MNKQHSFVQLIDLPDEILLTIFKKLNNVDTLHSLMGVNTRFDQILSDPVFTSSLTLLECILDCYICPLPNTMLDRFCSQIIPQIFHKIKWLNIESLAMERILLAAEYFNLCGLGLYNVTEETVIRIFIEKPVCLYMIELLKRISNNPCYDYFIIDFYIYLERTSFSRIDTNQISSLVIMITDVGRKRLTEYTITTVCAHVFSVFPNLRNLNICSSVHIHLPRLSFENNLPTFFSRSLMELHINLRNLDDLFHLLDGRFNQLRVLYVNIFDISSPSAMIGNKCKLANFRCFGLRCRYETSFYDELTALLLHRMSNLESLSLYFAEIDLDRFIDGHDLKKNIINHLPRLNKFVFNILSKISLDNQTSLPSNDDIQYTFTNFPDNQIVSCVDYFPKAKSGQCHIYSYPYTMDYYYNITNNFPGGLFKCVRNISLFDERPFEYEFFIRIAQAFPFLTKLSLNNRKGQKLKNNRIDYPLIKYPYLNDLELIDIHKDYVELFLDHTKIFFPNNISLSIEYRPLRKVTYDFKRDTMRTNCAKVTDLSIPAKFKQSQRFKAYFPRVTESVFYS